MTLDLFAEPNPRLNTIALHLWGDGRPCDLRPDVLICDMAQGGLSPRSLSCLRRGVAVALPDHRSMIQSLFHQTHADGGLAIIRLVSTATHGRDGPFGIATHRALSYSSALILQFDCDNLASARLIRDQGALYRATRTPWPVVADTMPPKPENLAIDNPWANSLAALLSTAMEGDFSVFRRGYDPGAELCLPGGVTRHGPDSADRFWLGLRTALPDAEFQVICGLGAEDTLAPPTAAVHWRLVGRHDGWGAFGAPSGKPMTVEGVSFAEFGPGGLRRECTVLDQVAIMGRLLHSGPATRQSATRPVSAMGALL